MRSAAQPFLTQIAALIVVWALAGCDSTPECSHASTDFSSLSCRAAVTFAARTSATIVPTQDEVDLYFERWNRVIDSEPALDGRIPQRYRNDLGTVSLLTRNATVIGAWSTGESITGDQEFDDLLDDLGERRPDAFPNGRDQGNGTYAFQYYVHVPFNEELLNARLAPTSSWLPEPVHHYRDDGDWRWIDPPGERSQQTAEIDFSFGWGDCFSGCAGMHQLRAVVPPVGSATVYDMGGDPLPDWVQPLSPNTKPPDRP